MFDIPLFRFGLPLHPWALCALGLAGLVLILDRRNRRHKERPPLTLRHRWWLACAVTLAGGLSLLYIRDFLRGGPRIIDATAYVLEARTLLTGSFTFVPPEPSDLFNGRFLLRAHDHPERIGVIFPPGFPAYLAIFEAFSASMLALPVLGALLVLATYALAQKLVETESSEGRDLRAAPLLAAALSAISITLRYHSADPMSHGLSALLTTVLVWLCIGGQSPFSRARASLMGLFFGLLFATRPITALCVAAVLFGLLWWRRDSTELTRPKAKFLALAALGSLPGLILYAAYQRALTGSFFGSAQLDYYALSDGPGACFGLGFGKGCLHEHGDVVNARGYLGPLWAALNSLHRLHQHSLDLANFEPIALALLGFLWLERRTLKGQLGLGLLGSLVLGYALFYFDGSYPGGGGRFLVEALPTEHACLALFAVRKAWSLRLLALSLFGFATHGIYSHLALEGRDGGAPFLSLRKEDLEKPAVVFVASDHAFLMGFDPRSLSAGTLHGTLIAHQSGDDRESLLLANLGLKEAATLGTSPPGSELIPYLPSPVRPGLLRFEAERAWPPLGIQGAWAHPVFSAEQCVSHGSGLEIQPDRERPGPPMITLALGTLAPAGSELFAYFWSAKGGCFERRFLLREATKFWRLPLTELVSPAFEGTKLLLDRWELRLPERLSGAQD